MKTFLGTAVTAAALMCAGAAHADEQITEHRSIDAATVRVKLDGVLNLKVRQGAAPSLTLYGEKRELSRVSVVQHGDTLVIDTERQGWNLGRNERQAVRAELTLPALSELSSKGVGATEVQGFSGNEVKLVLDGAGSVTVSSNYRKVVARLGGVGKMTLNTGDADRMDLNLRGAGHIAVNGQCRQLKADLGGVGSLDAKRLRADAVELDMSGLGGATVFASQSARLRLSGLGSATVYGKPASRSATAHGLGSVSWE